MSAGLLSFTNLVAKQLCILLILILLCAGCVHHSVPSYGWPIESYTELDLPDSVETSSSTDNAGPTYNPLIKGNLAF